MSSIEKNKKLIISKTANSSGGFDYVIKNKNNNVDVKLGDVFNYLPAGVIDKTETGIGGTSCEINSERHSIIVQPYTTTAYNKASFKPSHQVNNVHFFGRSKIISKGTKGKIRTVSVHEIIKAKMVLDLRDYLDESFKLNTPIKITCVTDQLGPLKDLMEEYKPGLFSSCHLVLDEIDCFQEHSNFRQVMEESIQIYKDHPSDKRSLISATVKQFEDPLLKEEPLTTIKYQTRQKGAIYVIETNYCEEECFQQIGQIFKKGQKIVVALNLLKSCVSLAKNLGDNPTYKNTSIKVLCSESSSKKVKEHFDVISEDGILPADINIVTSAYFNGIDINEQYHSIIVSNGLFPTLRLSSSLIYQISGRCRKKLLSNTLIVNIQQEFNFTEYGLNELENQAKEQTEIYRSLKVLKESKYNNTKDLVNQLTKVVVEGSKSFFSLCYIKGDSCMVSYLKIESRLEQQRTFKLYDKSSNFIRDLSKWFVVQKGNPIHKKGDTKSLVKIDTKTEGLSILSSLTLINTSQEIKRLQSETLVYNKQLSLIFEIYMVALENTNIDRLKLDNVVKHILSQRQSNLTGLLVFVLFHTQVSPFPTSKFFKLFSKYFVVDEVYSLKELNDTCKEFCQIVEDFDVPEKLKRLKELINKPTIVKTALLNLKKDRSSKQRSSKIVNYLKYDIFQ